MCKKDSFLESRDWANLLPELVLLISQKVKSISDYVRFRGVCSSWRSISPPKPCHLPPQLPLLLLPYDPHPEKYSPGETDDGIRLLYDVWKGKMRELSLPESNGMMCCASYRGWLLLVAKKGREVFLLNPLSRSQIQLPPFTTPVSCLGNEPNGPRFDASYFFDSCLGNFGKSKMTFSTDLTNPNCLITVFLRGCWVLCCRVGDLCWARIISRRGRDPIDVTCYNGRFYLLYKGTIDIVDSNKPQEKATAIFDQELRDVRMHILEGKSGVHVVAYLPENIVELYQLEEQSLKLKVIGTKNAIIFCGSYWLPYLAVSSEDWDSLQGDSMYMEYNYSYSANTHGLGTRRSIFSCHPDGNMIEHIVRDPGHQNRRFLALEPAMWFQPSFG